MRTRNRDANAVKPGTIGGLEELQNRYDHLICDVWGVLYDGFQVHPKARNALEEWKRNGKNAVLLSNSPRDAEAMAAQLAQRGLARDLYLSLLTSGTAARRILRHGAGDARLPPPHLYIGPEGSGLREELLGGLKSTNQIENAGSIVLAGSPNDHWGTRFDEGTLEQAAKRGLAMLCTNPDLHVRRGDKLEPCPGTTARQYEALGGRVLYVGKPHRPVYDLCLAALGLRGETAQAGAGGRVLAIGDGIHTDIRGAQMAGLDSLFITSGIHREEGRKLKRRAALRALYEREGATPTWCAPALAWSAGRTKKSRP